MVRRLRAVLHYSVMPFVNRWQMVFHHPCRSLSSLVKLRGRELRRGRKVRAGTRFGAIAVGGLLSKDGRRAYANNEANVSVTAMDLVTNTVLTRDIPAGEPPAPGTFEHDVLVGKLAFFTALDIPDNGFFDMPIRDIVPLNSRGKQSNNAWSSCGSCHPDGLSDGVTWLFAAGPRQTIPLDGTFAHDTHADDRRPLNWSAVRSSNTDFNNNSRGVQGGCGFASDAFAPPGTCTTSGATTPANPNIYDHSIAQGGSDALDAQTLWIFAAVRPLKQPQPSSMAALAGGPDHAARGERTGPGGIGGVVSLGGVVAWPWRQ